MRPLCMDLDLKDKTAFVAAASSGLGLSVAKRLLNEGASVTISSRNQSNLKDAKSTLLNQTNRNGDAVNIEKVDLSETNAIERGIESAVEQFNGLDILVTNHGGPMNTTFEQTSLEEFDEGYSEVLRSTLSLTKNSLPALRESGGTITHLVAASAAEPTSYGAVGNIFRPGIYSLSKVLSKEEGANGIRSNCVAPRGVMTDRITSKIEKRADREGISEEEVRELRVEELPLSSLGTTEEFANAVAFLSSPAASNITGTVLQVDGGWSRRIL